MPFKYHPNIPFPMRHYRITLSERTLPDVFPTPKLLGPFAKMHRCFCVDQDSVDIHKGLHKVVLNATIISGYAWIDTTTASRLCLLRHISLMILFLSLRALFSPYSQIRFTLSLVVAHCEIISVGSVPNATIISGLLRFD